MKEFVTKDINERNKLLEELYFKEIPYTYTETDKEGNYHVKYKEQTKTQ